MFYQISIFSVLLFILIGFNIGILSGFFGVGGCFILTPLLNILGLPMAQAVGTGLFFAVIVSSFAGLKHYLAGNSLIKVSIIMGLVSFVGIQLSQPLVIYLDSLNLAGFYIRLLYIILLLTLGFLTIRKKTTNSIKDTGAKKKPSNIFRALKYLPPKISIEPDLLPISIWPMVMIALIVGCLQGFLGVGGGFILVPVLILFFNMQPHHAVGTSLVTIVISSIFAAFLYFLDGKVLIPVSLLLGLGSLAGVSFGVSATCKITGDKLRHLYSIFLLLTSIGIALKSLEYNLFSMIYMLILSFSIGLFILFRYYFNNKNSYLSE
ncbi:MAG TPA: sulfite exporter TauE/SafE family protein [Atribacterota bacterium]|nr:sulfite exporter TauE/SafE family protein [Atribacterota bacterium]